LAISGKDLDFKISKEDWNVYELADGSILKVRFVLRKVILCNPTYVSYSVLIEDCFTNEKYKLLQ